MPFPIQIHDHMLTAPLVTVSQLREHLDLLRAFAALKRRVGRGGARLFSGMEEMEEEAEWWWELFVACAVERFEAWCIGLAALEEDDINELVEWIPPLDVFMIWHSYLLNPSWYLEDSIRLPALSGLWRLGKRVAAALGNGLADLLVEAPSPERIVRWQKCSNDSEFDPFRAAQRLHRKSKEITCSRCVQTLHAPFFNTNGTGYLQKNFSFPCNDCALTNTHRTLALHKLATDLAREETGRAADLLAGTLYNPSSNPPTSLSGARQFKDRILASSSPILRRRSRFSDAEYAARLGQKAGYDLWTLTRECRLAAGRPPSVEANSNEDKGQMTARFNSAYAPTCFRIFSMAHILFLDLMSSTANKMFVPTPDIDLAWHTHQLMANDYFNDTLEYVGRFIDHDDKIPADSLATSLEDTRRAWRERFGIAYDTPRRRRRRHPRKHADEELSDCSPEADADVSDQRRLQAIWDAELDPWTLQADSDSASDERRRSRDRDKHNGLEFDGEALADVIRAASHVWDQPAILPLQVLDERLYMLALSDPLLMSTRTQHGLAGLDIYNADIKQLTGYVSGRICMRGGTHDKEEARVALGHVLTDDHKKITLNTMKSTLRLQSYIQTLAMLRRLSVANFVEIRRGEWEPRQAIELIINWAEGSETLHQFVLSHVGNLPVPVLQRILCIAPHINLTAVSVDLSGTFDVSPEPPRRLQSLDLVESPSIATLLSRPVCAGYVASLRGFTVDFAELPGPASVVTDYLSSSVETLTLRSITDAKEELDLNLPRSFPHLTSIVLPSLLQEDVCIRDGLQTPDAGNDRSTRNLCALLTTMFPPAATPMLEQLTLEPQLFIPDDAPPPALSPQLLSALDGILAAHPTLRIVRWRVELVFGSYLEEEARAAAVRERITGLKDAVRDALPQTTGARKVIVVEERM
ncbi:hypothetical protein MKEN_01173000 [Mycena kentingensis (nom. inval.)]|nr:hypothetical protein MKEN_01173000 [Mycena kentingensis (nom. inval.)]